MVKLSSERLEIRVNAGDRRQLPAAAGMWPRLHGGCRRSGCRPMATCGCDAGDFSTLHLPGRFTEPDLFIRTGGEAAHQQFPALAIGLYRIIFAANAVAGLYRR